VRKELASRFNIAGSLLGLAGPREPIPRMRAAKAAARHLLHAQRFEIRVIDAEDADDGIAEAAMHSLRKAYKSRARVLREVLNGHADDLSEDTQSAKPSTSMSSSSSDDSDRYFGSEGRLSDDEDVQGFEDVSECHTIGKVEQDNFGDDADEADKELLFVDADAQSEA
ncbi:unnamed protein product, partial [Polarella glacialis]